MNTYGKLAAFGVGLVAVFGVAAGLGAVVGPVGPAAETSPAGHDDGAGHGDDACHTTGADAAHLPGDLLVGEESELTLTVTVDGYEEHGS